MGKSLAIKLTLAVVVVLVASFGTVRVRQIQAEAQAHSPLDRARVAALAELRHGSAVGLRPSELASFSGRLRRLEQSPAPHASPLWNASAPSFYDSKVTAYRRLRRGMVRTITRITRATAAAAGAAQRTLTHDIARANGLDIATAAAGRLLVQQSSALKAATTPGQFRAVQSSLVSGDGALEATIGANMRTLNLLIAGAHGTLTGIGDLADTAAASPQPPLDLLQLLTPRAARYQSQIARLRSLVHSQTKPLTAAVKELELQRVVASATADAAHTLPAKMIVVSTAGEWAHLYEGTRLTLDTPVTTGGPELPTDHGVFHIYFKASPFVFHSPWPPDSPFYYFPTPIQFWMPFDGAEGLHDASWRSDFGPGSNLVPTYLGTGRTIQGTHGCVNLPFDAAQFIWDWAPVGTTVVVI
ncbi:MAG: L,D-transpeptidase [Chloroflexota bacterium]|nr:L,D-transpeptidase [Chloroflexota bacterium]